jgi:hypothetical protein
MDALPVPQTESLTPAEMFDPLPSDVELAFKRLMNQNLNEEELLSVDFQPAGHGGSHPYLVNEFVNAVYNKRHPAINVWESVRYMAMGIAAHQSALKDGETVAVADWGEAPK